MKIKCPRCSSKLEVETVGDLVSCPDCLIEFAVEEPKPRRSFHSFIYKINWLRLAVIGLSISITISVISLIGIAYWMQSKSPEGFDLVKGIIGSVGTALLGILLLAFVSLLTANIVLWIFLPLMVLNIKNQLAEVLIELKKITEYKQK
jgi:hypothetical protein